jgi:tetratricopeptide (TPR) repeat protein
VALFRQEAYPAALEKFEEALRHAADRRHSAEIYNDIGVTQTRLGNYGAAHQALDEAMARFTELDDQKGQAQTLGNRAALYQAEELLDDAAETYKQSAALFEQAGENEMAMYVWQAVSRVRLKQGRHIEAIGAYEEGVDNMPKGSFKRTILQKILKMPGALLGTGSSGGDEPDEDEED